MKKYIILLLSLTFLFLPSSCSDDNDKDMREEPQSAFSTNKESYTVGDEVFLTDASTPKNAAIKEWYWHFGFDGKGNYSTEKNTSVLYSKAGKYAIKLTVTDEMGAYGTFTDTIVINPTNIPPAANFSISPDICKVNEEITLTDISTDEDGEVVSREWDLGNGTTSTEKQVKVTYTTVGFVTVKLTVTDDRGDSTTKEQILNIRSDVQAGDLAILWSQTFESGSSLRSISPAVGNNGYIYMCHPMR